VIQWIYKQAASASLEASYNYDSVMNLNVQTGAFYPWSIDTTVGALINSIVVTKGANTVLEEVLVTDSSVQVTDSSENVSAFVATSTTFANTFRFLTSKNTAGSAYDMTWSTERDSAFVDWETPGVGVSYSSYVISGYAIAGQAQRDFQSDYIWIYFDTQADSSCYFQSIWDYSTVGAKRTSTAWQAYRNRTARDVQVARILVRGSGKARQFRLYSEAGKPFSLIGWSVWNTQTNLP
jgi:hypothetical protein